jgi:hypothetical protein
VLLLVLLLYQQKQVQMHRLEMLTGLPLRQQQQQRQTHHVPGAWQWPSLPLLLLLSACWVVSSS